MNHGHRIPASRIVTTARTPLLPKRDARMKPLIWGRSQAIFWKSECDIICARARWTQYAQPLTVE
jgi:hypothetical protein